MGRILNIVIIVLLLAWILGMIFSAIFGLLIHILLVFAVIAVGVKIYLWFRSKRSPERRGSAREGSAV